MGTRSLTLVYEEGSKKPFINMYRQYDGYPSGHGLELAEFLGSFAAVTNGIMVGETRKTANGMGCLAAQLVANFKTEVGGIYLYPVSARDCGQEYEYHIYQDRVVIKDYNGSKIFDGSWQELKDFCDV